MIEEIGRTTEGDLIINVGPQHPATHGVLHLVITLNGETIKKVEPHLGYIHRSIEKMCESLSYRQFIYVTSRMDYLSSHINNHGCALCVEKGLQIEVPQRAQYIRVIMDELTRIASHELWWGAMAMDLGAFTPFFHAFRERENHHRYHGKDLRRQAHDELYGAGWCNGRTSSRFSERCKTISLNYINQNLKSIMNWLPAM